MREARRELRRDFPWCRIETCTRGAGFYIAEIELVFRDRRETTRAGFCEPNGIEVTIHFEADTLDKALDKARRSWLLAFAYLIQVHQALALDAARRRP